MDWGEDSLCQDGYSSSRPTAAKHGEHRCRFYVLRLRHFCGWLVSARPRRRETAAAAPKVQFLCSQALGRSSCILDYLSQKEVLTAELYNFHKHLRFEFSAITKETYRNVMSLSESLIVHTFMHTHSNGEIELSAEDGSSCALPLEELRQFLSSFNRPLKTKLVMALTCYGRKQADL